MQCLPLESATNEHADIESTTGWNQSPVVWSSSGTPVGNLDDLTVAAGGMMRHWFQTVTRRWSCENETNKLYLMMSEPMALLVDQASRQPTSGPSL